ncbi:MAG: bacteriohemerythrin [Magnetococcales bacterium]|nr:bacteriohemerythrin [Magnetococcales bacterium]
MSQAQVEPFMQELSREDFKRMLLWRLKEVKEERFHQEHLVLLEIITDLFVCVRLFQRKKPLPADKRELDGVLERLKNYTFSHFQGEELFMRERLFPGLQAHLQAHRRFLGAFQVMETRIHNEGISHVVDLFHLTISWLFDHINQMDLQYSRFISGEAFTSVSQPLTDNLPSPEKPAPKPTTRSFSTALEELGSQICDVGVEKFNREHRKLLDRMQRFSTLMTHLARHRPTSRDWLKIDELVHFFTDFTRDHFAGEEQMMQQYGYPQAEVHRLQHQRLRDRLAILSKSLVKERDIATAIDLQQFLYEWLLNHIQKSDVAYGAFFQQKGVF